MKRLFLMAMLIAISSIAMDKPTTPDESENQNTSSAPSYRFRGGRFGDITPELVGWDPIRAELDAEYRLKQLEQVSDKNDENRTSHDPTTIELIEKEQYGPELARKLDAIMLADGYTYFKRGLYQRHNGVFQHSLPRHLCEPGVDRKQAEAMNEHWNRKYYTTPLETSLNTREWLRVSTHNSQIDTGPILVIENDGIHLFKMVDGKLVDQGLKIPTSENK